ncbi:InlB B-repeat-containing protein, partial [Christensenellaceae bacterium OttesenSCG-928-K19]|nr:InlB B-repeat-containing protein [Christensenellaceae bacterium OttesenSCG-928-K19]
MKKQTGKRIWTLLLAVVMLVGLMPATVYAEGESCTHTHDAACNYVEGVEASPCTFAHEHDGTCGWAEAVEGAPCNVEAAHTTHDATCGGDPETGEGCTFAHTHDIDCGYVQAKDAVPCDVETAHTHDGDCGYAEAVQAQPCTHSCELCAPAQNQISLFSLSSDASLLKVAGYTIKPGSEQGTDADPIMADITVPNAKASIAAGDLVVAENATVNLYSNNGFSADITNTGLNLSDGANELYIKVTAEDTATVLYYHITATRVVSGAAVITTTSLPDGMVGVPYYASIASNISALETGRVWTCSNLPDGLTFDGTTLASTITGTPTTPGTYTVVASVKSDTKAESAPIEYTVIIVASEMEVVGFGGHEWLVVGDSRTGIAQTANALTLLSRNRDFNDSIFHGTSNNYSGSALQIAMDGYAGTLPTKEQRQIVPRDFAGGATYNDGSDAVAGAAVNDALFWPLSTNEANGLSSDYYRQYGALWWLRSPGTSSSDAAVVLDDGSVLAPGDDVGSADGIRPAFHLNLQSALFTSAASNASGKDLAAVGGALIGASAPANFYKFTMVDDALLGTLASTTATANGGAGDTISLNFTHTPGTGTPGTISAIITDTSGGGVLYYGKLASYAATGTVKMTIPAGLADGSYTIKLFAEQINGDNFTDFASTPVEIPLTVTTGGNPPATYTVTYAGGGAAGGSVPTDTNSPYASGATVTVLGNTGGLTRTDYSFAGWKNSVDNVTYTAGQTFVINSNVTLTAQWTYTDPDPDPGPTYEYRTITDPATGVSVTGYFTPGTRLKVTEKALHPAGTCAACDEIRASGGWAALYDVSITGQHSGNIELRLPVDSSYNGQSMSVWHCKRGHVEKLSGTAKDGVVSITVSSLSPFAVFAANDKNNPNTGGLPDDADVDVPQTGDSSNVGGWLALLAVSLLLMGLAV